jgi:hypothetical protein
MNELSSERFGRHIGQGWRRMLRLQNRLLDALARAGLPPVAAWLVVAALWAFILGCLIHYGFRVAIVAALFMLLSSLDGARVPNSVDREWEWRRGPLGFGVYDADGYRLDPHEPPDRHESRD